MLFDTVVSFAVDYTLLFCISPLNFALTEELPDELFELSREALSAAWGRYGVHPLPQPHEHEHEQSAFDVHIHA